MHQNVSLDTWPVDLVFQVSATFAASLVMSPAIGAFLSWRYGDSLVVLLATIIAVADILFVLLVVPESLPVKMRQASSGSPISWEQADPFGVSYIFCGFIYSVLNTSYLGMLLTSDAPMLKG